MANTSWSSPANCDFGTGTLSNQGVGRKSQSCFRTDQQDNRQTVEIDTV